MIITTQGIIVFHLVERIVLNLKSCIPAFKYGRDMLGFSYPAGRTRHEIHGKPYPQEE